MQSNHLNRMQRNARNAGLAATFLVAVVPQVSLAQKAKKADKPETEIVENTPNQPEVKFTLGKYTSQRKLHDFDQDGWCDLWCAMHPEIKHRNKKVDSDGDGLTDYQEMVLMRNASVAGPMPRHLTPEEIAEGKEKAKEVKKLKGVRGWDKNFRRWLCKKRML